MSPLYDQRSTSSSARRAGGRHPSTSSRPPGDSFPRASSLDHSPPTSGRWIRRPPHRRDGQSLGPARGSVGLMTLYFFIVQGSQGVGYFQYANSRPSADRVRPFSPRGRRWPGGPDEGGGSAGRPVGSTANRNDGCRRPVACDRAPPLTRPHKNDVSAVVCGLPLPLRERECAQPLAFAAPSATVRRRISGSLP